MLRHAVKIKTRPAPDKQPASSAASVALSGPSLMNGPVKKKPWASPTSTPRKSGATPVRYAGRFDRKLATSGEEVTGVSSMPMNGSPLIGLIICTLPFDADTVEDVLLEKLLTMR